MQRSYPYMIFWNTDILFINNDNTIIKVIYFIT